MTTMRDPTPHEPTDRTSDSRSPRIRAGFGLIAAAGVVALVLAAGAPTATAERPGSAAVAQVETVGEAVFARQCAGCHGAAGQGGIGPDLRLWTGTVEALAEVVAGGANGMPAFSPTLVPDQIDAVAVSVDQLVGTSVYLGECASCHGTDGEGGLGPSLTTSRTGDAERRSTIEDGRGAMPGFGDTLDQQAIDALVWRTAGYQEVGRTLFATHCAACHGPSGDGGTGPSLVDSAIEEDEAAAIVENGFGGMPAFGSTLREGAIEAVISFALGLEPGGPPTTSTSTTTTTLVTSAPELYSAHCASCHGDDAEGAIGPPLTRRRFEEPAVREVITAGRGSMPGFGDVLAPEQVSALVAFVETLAAPPGGTEGTPAGAELYAHQCAACHGADGRGGLGPSLRTTLLTGNELRAAIVQGNPTMPAFGLSLASEELGVITDFVEWLRRTDQSIVTLRGGPAIYRQDCAGCHGPSGEGGVGPELQGTGLTVNEIVARVYGGHEAGMPAFAGALDGQQVRAVAEYVRRFESAVEPDDGLDVYLVAVIVLGVAVVAVTGLILTSHIRERRDLA